MTTKMGRPKIDNPKSKQLGVRFDQKLLDKLDELVAYHRKTRVDILRLGIENLYSELPK